MKSFKTFIEQKVEETPTMSTANVPGTGDDSSLVIVRKRRKVKPLTRHYIEIAGKRKRIVQ